MDAQAMTRFPFVPHDTAALVLSGGAWLMAGMLAGVAYFLTLRWNVRLLALGRSFVLALALQLARFAAVAGLLAVIAAHHGALPLVAAACGIVAARTVFVRSGAPR